MKEQAKSFGTEFSFATEITNYSFTDEEKWVELDGDEKVYARFIIIATGRSPRKLN